MTSIVDIAPPQFRFLTSEEWGMRWARPPVTEGKPDPECYVHHTAGGRLGTDGAEAFRSLNEFAISGKGYSAIDYDYLIHLSKPTGIVTIGEARGEWMSAATKDRNEMGEAVCLMGYFHPGHILSEQPTADEIEGIALAIVWGIEQGNIAADASILGHRDNPAHPGATGCPGDYVYAKMGTIRSRVAYWLAAKVEPEPPKDNDMNAPIIRVEGYQDQFLCIPLSGETKKRLSPANPTPTVLAAKNRSEWEQIAGYPLTPQPGE